MDPPFAGGTVFTVTTVAVGRVSLRLACLGVGVALSALARADAGRDQLRVIVQQQCVPHWTQSHDPAPCISVRTIDDGAAPEGFAVLADRKGGAHFLLIPTRTISGIESPEVRGARALNYFAAAWEARYVLVSAVGHAVPRTAVGMAVNQHRARSQDQLHIHLSCLSRRVHDALQSQAASILRNWSSVSIGGARYQALRIMGSELGSANPFELLAARVPDAAHAMDEYTVLVAGMQFKEGPGFAVLAGREVPGAELLLDAGCALAR
jgi:CDP-diacylglycerol pyrophosphatase